MKYQRITGPWPTKQYPEAPRNPAADLLAVLSYVTTADDMEGLNLEPLAAFVGAVIDKAANTMHDLAYYEPEYKAAEFEVTDLHHAAFNEDYFVTYTSDAAQILDDLNHLQALRFVLSAERSVLGQDIQGPDLLEYINDPVRLVNLLAYFVGESVLATATARASARYPMDNIAGQIWPTNEQVLEALEELRRELKSPKAEAVREFWAV